MKITVFQMTIAVFVTMWVIGDVFGSSYNEKLYWAIIMSACFAYFNNAHGEILKWVKNNILRWKTS
jgi:hypothetical protein